MQTSPFDMPPPMPPKETGRLIRPMRLALIIAGIFLVITLPYILVSGNIALESSQSMADLESIEKIKGTIFVATTSVLLFVLCYVLFRRIARREQALARYRNALIAAERRAAAGVFASSVAHDMNNVLTIVDYATRTLSKHGVTQDAEIVADLKNANGQLKRLSSVLMRASGRNLPETVADFNLANAVRETTELARTHKRVKYCTVTLETPDALPFSGIPIMIHQMLLNLIINAADATGRRGTIDVRLTAKNDGAQIAVHDSGPGIPEIQRDVIMEPFVTTKTDGSGLGLLSVKVCAESHDGQVQIDTSTRLGGACFKVQLKSKRQMVNVPERAKRTESAPSVTPAVAVH